MAGRTSLTVYEGMIGMSENVFINTKNRSHTVTAEVVIPKGGAKGVILAQAGRFGGWSLYLKDGKPTYTYNFLGLQRFTIAAKQPVAPGKATIRYEFAYDGGGLGKGGVGRIFVDDKKVAEGRIGRTQLNIFSADEGADVGEDGETPVVETYGIAAPYRFTGKIDRVTVELAPMPAQREEERKAGRWLHGRRHSLIDAVTVPMLPAYTMTSCCCRARDRDRHCSSRAGLACTGKAHRGGVRHQVRLLLLSREALLFPATSSTACRTRCSRSTSSSTSSRSPRRWSSSCGTAASPPCSVSISSVAWSSCRSRIATGRRSAIRSRPTRCAWTRSGAGSSRRTTFSLA